VVFVLLLPVAWFGYRLAAPGADWQDSVAMSPDVAALVFLVSLAPLLRHYDVTRMRRHAAENEANRALVLLITTVLTFVVMTAISGELAAAKAHQLAAMVKLVVTLLVVWVFANTVYALHYAHAFYSSEPGSRGDRAGLEFPGTAQPDYGDFLYFAFTLGMTFQTSDIQITARGIRRVALFHSIVAFIFNLGVLAFIINTLAGVAG
jgi:uncharacterized membrane protein